MKVIFAALVVILGITFAPNSQAAISMKEILSRPTNEHLGMAQKLGLTQAYRQSQLAAKDQSLPIRARWSAVLLMEKTGGALATQELRSMLSSKDWFIRNSSLLALNSRSENEGLSAGRILLRDRSLVVRSAAVSVFPEEMTEKDRELMRDQLEASLNFNRGQSLWVRGEIMAKLSAKPSFSERAWFLNKIKDKDAKVSLEATRALERMTGTKAPLAMVSNRSEIYEFYSSLVK
jgi:hypothetical protein